MDKNGEVSDKRLGARDAILLAFRESVLGGSFEAVRVSDLAERAGVARSTFYEHFQSRDDVLRESMRAPLQPLADLAGTRPDEERAALVLEHFREGKALSLALLDGPSGALVRDLMAEMIGGDAKTAYAIAGAQLALIGAWLTGKDAGFAQELASTFRSVSVALRGCGGASV